MLWLVAAAALPLSPVEYTPEMVFAPAQTKEIRLPFRRPLRADPEGFQVDVKVLEGSERFRRLPALRLERTGLIYYLQAPGAPADVGPVRERFVMQVDLSFGGRVRRRLKIRHILRLDPRDPVQALPLLSGELELPSDIAAPIRERALRHYVLTSTQAAVPRALAALPSEEAPELAEMEVRAQLVALVRALSAGRFASAEAHAAQLRARPSLDSGELARLLELEAGLALLRGRDSIAFRRFQEALTLFPQIETQHPSPYVRARFEALRTRLQPERPLDVGKIDLEREGSGLRIRVGFGPDPGRLVETVQVELPAEGQQRSARAQHEGADGHGELMLADFPRRDQRLTMSVQLLDEQARILAELGAEQAVSVPILEAKKTGRRVPSWVWWTLGAAALAGAGTAIGFAVANDRTPQPDRNLGPFEFRF